MRSPIALVRRRPRRAAAHAVPRGVGSVAPDAGDADALLDSAFLRQLERLRFAAPRWATAGLAGEHASRRSAHAVEFADHRSYVPGDDIRLVDWNAYARLGEMCLRLSEAQENLRIHLLLDCSASMNWGQPNKLLYAKRVAAALGALALVSYDTVSLGALSGDLLAASPALRGRSALADLVASLRGIAPGRSTELARATATYCAPRRGRGVAILLTDCLVATGLAEALDHLGRAGLRATVVHLVDSRDRAPELDGLLALHDCETGEVVRVGATPEVLRRYASHFETWTGELAALCRTHRAGYVQVSTAIPPSKAILNTLRRQGVLQ